MMKLKIDEKMLEAVIEGTAQGLEMADTPAVAVGASRIIAVTRPLSIMVGLVGEQSGTITINITEWAMLYLTGRMLGEEQTEPTETNLDCMMEIGNIVAGHVKNGLQQAGYSFTGMSVPALIWGASYKVHYARGMVTVAVEFELDGISVARLNDRFFSVSATLMRGSGQPGG